MDTATPRTGPRFDDSGSVDRVVYRAAGADLEADLEAHGVHETRMRAARSRWLGPALAGRLSRSAVADLRGRVATNVRCPPAVLARLLADPKVHVRAAARRNPGTPYDLLGSLPLEELLESPHCPGDLVASALDDRHLRLDVALHPNLPDDVRRQIIEGTDDYQRSQLLENPSTTHADALAVIAATPAQHLVNRWRWAKHPNAAPAWLEQTARETFESNDQGTIARVAAHPATPGHVLARIAAGHPHRDYALENPSCPAHVLLAELHRTPETDRNVTDHGYRSRRDTIALNPATDAEALALIDASALQGMRLFEFVLTRATAAEGATALLALAPTWTGSLADLLAAADAVSL